MFWAGLEHWAWSWSGLDLLAVLKRYRSPSLTLASGIAFRARREFWSLWFRELLLVSEYARKIEPRYKVFERRAPKIQMQRIGWKANWKPKTGQLSFKVLSKTVAEAFPLLFLSRSAWYEVTAKKSLLPCNFPIGDLRYTSCDSRLVIRY